jgi:hypothetical protein
LFEETNTLMRNLLKTAALSAFLLAGVPAKAQVSVGIVIGAPPAPRVVAVMPAQPAPDFMWVGGYWYPVAGHYRWHEGYWTRPPYGGARWVAPRHEGGHFYAGYWDGPHGRFEHDHKWDKGHGRDNGHFHEHQDHGHDHDDHGHGH